MTAPKGDPATELIAELGALLGELEEVHSDFLVSFDPSAYVYEGLSKKAVEEYRAYLSETLPKIGAFCKRLDVSVPFEQVTFQSGEQGIKVLDVEQGKPLQGSRAGEVCAPGAARGGTLRVQTRGRGLGREVWRRMHGARAQQRGTVFALAP
jgi:hypothetical protein